MISRTIVAAIFAIGTGSAALAQVEVNTPRAHVKVPGGGAGLDIKVGNSNKTPTDAWIGRDIYSTDGEHLGEVTGIALNQAVRRHRRLPRHRRKACRAGRRQHPGGAGRPHRLKSHRDRGGETSRPSTRRRGRRTSPSYGNDARPSACSGRLLRGGAAAAHRPEVCRAIIAIPPHCCRRRVGRRLLRERQRGQGHGETQSWPNTLPFGGDRRPRRAQPAGVGAALLGLGRQGGEQRQRPRARALQSQIYPGQVIVSFGDRRLYLITRAGEAISYPVAIPREQDRWQGVTKVSDKRVNPAWRPTPDMLRENPKLPSWVPGGHPMNPLGVRALYLGSSTYRITAPMRRGRSARRPRRAASACSTRRARSLSARAPSAPR